MAFNRSLVVILLIVLVGALNSQETIAEVEEITDRESADSQEVEENSQEEDAESEGSRELEDDNPNPSNVFNGVYTECLLKLSYECVQRKTLHYLRELNELKEITILGDYLKFVKLNTSKSADDAWNSSSSEDLARQIDTAVDQFFDSHLLRFEALGRDIMVPETVEEFVGRKRRKGGGGGGGGHGGGDDGGKKKMMMMAMMCMKMKFMMMVPAMMGMMGMMSFKTMMFSMMSFMMAKMMLLMKILEKKGGGGGGGGGGWNAGGGDGGWAAGGGGGAWMPAGQDYGGGYDANGQWQSRSIIEADEMKANKPIITYVKPIVRYNDRTKDPKPLIAIKHLKNEVLKMGQVKNSRRKRSEDGIVNSDRESGSDETIEDLKNIGETVDMYKDESEGLHMGQLENSRRKRGSQNRIINLDGKTVESSKNIWKTEEMYNESGNRDVSGKIRKKRSILDDLSRAYVYWMNKVLGIGYKKHPATPKYRIVNGIKYIYQPIPQFKKIKSPKELYNNEIKQVNVEEFNKGEIVEPADSRSIKKKIHKMKNKMNNVNETVEENPWE